MDFGTLGKVERTSLGGLRVDSGLTRVGVFSYQDAGGREVKEYRSPEEVFHQDSLATLEDVPVTNRHPPVMVGPQNFREYASGQVLHGTVRQDDTRLVAKLAIQESGLIASVEKRDATEVSCGYTCLVDNTPGVTPAGERYDRIQRRIRYNHVAIVPKGRAGSEISLRLDGAGNVVNPAGPTHGAKPRKEKTMQEIRIDGIKYPLGTDAERQAAAQAMARYQTKLDAEGVRVATLTAERDSFQGRADAADLVVKDLETKLAAATDPTRMDAAINSRLGVIQTARSIMGEEAKLDGLTERQVMDAAILHGNPETKLDGRSDDYVQGLFAGVAARADAASAADPDGLGRIRQGTQPKPGQRRDSDTDSEAARKRMDEANRTAWSKPLAFSKDAPQA